MFAILMFLAMSLFAAVTSWTSRRSGAGITRRPYGNIYSDAPGARQDVPDAGPGSGAPLT